jgi:hypothetical protein
VRRRRRAPGRQTALVLTHCLLLGVQGAEDALHAADLALQRPDAAVSELDVAFELLEEAARVPGHI